jgi:hypothetical protein
MADRPESASDRERLTMPLGDDDTLRLGEDDTVRLGDDDTLPLDPKRH